jgi:hypothetical protein
MKWNLITNGRKERCFDTASDLQALEEAAAEAGIEPEGLQQVLSGVAEAYKTDRGWGLIKAALDEN